jgi:hypothetical protein
LTALAKIRIQGREINFFDWQPVGAGAIVAAAANRLANTDPVGGAIACAVKTLVLDKGFDEYNIMGINGLPVVAKSARDVS